MPRRRDDYVMPPISLGIFLLEMLLLLLAMLFFARTYWNLAARLRPNGGDWTFLLSTGGYSAEIFRQTGRLPLWNPFLGYGEPMLEGVLSFILNPFMFLPVLWKGVVVGGKIGILVHIALMGAGGWLLGRVLRFRMAGRVLLGLLLMGAGGFAAPVGEGHYQIGLSLAYVPWVLAGLIATLYLRRRWPIGILVVSTVLMIFAGSFWYVVPLAVVCALLAIFGIFDRIPGARFPIVINWSAVERVTVALLLILLLGAIRLLPQFNSARFLRHPPETLNEIYTWQSVLQIYTQPTVGDNATPAWLRYNYIFPGVVAAILIAAWALVKPGPGRGRFVILTIGIPLLLSFILFTLLATGYSPLSAFLYSRFSFLSNWRRLGRFGAMATPSLAILMAWVFDNLVWRLQSARVPQSRISLRLLTDRLSFPLPLLAARILLVLVIVAGAGAGVDVVNNWQRVTSQTPTDPYDGQLAGVTYIRNFYPSPMLSINTMDMAPTVEFFPALARQTVGNPEIGLFGSPATMGLHRLRGTLPQFTAGYRVEFLQAVSQLGYFPLPGAPSYAGKVPSAWERPNALPYALRIAWDKAQLNVPADRSEMESLDYFHQIDSVVVNVPAHTDKDVIVIQETSYPGWTVTVNDQPATLISFDDLSGVVLRGTEPATVVFRYVPTVLYWGAAISLLGFALFVIYMLRLDRVLPSDPDGRRPGLFTMTARVLTTRI